MSKESAAILERTPLIGTPSGSELKAMELSPEASALLEQTPLLDFTNSTEEIQDFQRVDWEVKVVFKRQGSWMACTGWFYDWERRGKQFVVTAAHCVSEYSQDYTEMAIMLADNGNIIMSRYKVNVAYIPNGWTDTQSDNSDFAFLDPANTALISGMFNVRTCDTDSVNIVGFASNDYYATKTAVTLMTSLESDTYVFDGFFVTGGMSGSVMKSRKTSSLACSIVSRGGNFAGRAVNLPKMQSLVHNYRRVYY